MEDFAAQCAAHYQHVYRFALSLSRDARIAEDITQETFVRAFRGYARFERRCSVYTWLCQIAKNTYFAHVRKEEPYVTEVCLPELTAEGTIESIYLEREREIALHQALHRMEEPYKEVLTLRIFGELGYAQIAALFQKSESWARVTFYRAKEKLRTIMEVELYGD